MKNKHNVPEALIGILVTLSLGFKKNGSADSRAFANVMPAKIFKTDAMVPPLTPPEYWKLFYLFLQHIINENVNTMDELRLICGCKCKKSLQMLLRLNLTLEKHN